MVCSILSIFPETQQWNREHYSRSYEVFLDVPMEEFRRRDPKGLYRAAASRPARSWSPWRNGGMKAATAPRGQLP